jgi:hypothetical protein
MARIILENRSFISLDSIDTKVTEVNQNLTVQSTKLNDIMNQTQKMIHQLRIQNMYKAHENDFIIDDNIFENDEID